MKISKLLIPTQKETPNDATIISHKLMLRAGLISKLASGLYNYLPLGLMVVRNIENIIRKEMHKSGAQEVLMPIAQPAELWHKTNRFDKYGFELIKFNDRHNREFCLAPTHEEVITTIASQYISSYKQLPINFYQIQTKFRDEIRPRFGLMRAREFIMKDAYSFHLDSKCLQKTYQIMHDTYCNIFTKLGLNYKVVLADSGAIGGSISHEFHVLANSGEDEIAFSDSSNFTANIDAITLKPESKAKQPTQELTLVDTPHIKTIADVVKFLQIDIKKTVKTLIVEDANGSLFALVLRGDDNLNEAKLNKLDKLALPITMANESTIQKSLNCSIGSIGVVGLNIPILVDYRAICLSDFVCGANIDNKHYIGVNWQRDVKDSVTSLDLRNAKQGDASPDGHGSLVIKRGIEVGHIFQLGDKYTKILAANIIDSNSKSKPLIMGCYGIGVSRLVGAIIEQNYDDNGIIFPESVAPFKLIIVPINYHKSHRVANYSNKLYQSLLAKNISVILYDSKERAGVMFSKSELLGIPHRIVISDSLIDNNNIEYKFRKDSDKSIIAMDDALDFITSRCNS